MGKEKIAVIGDKDSVLAFKAVGARIFPVSDDAEARETLKNAARSYPVIFITEKFARAAEPLLLRYKSRAYPAVIPIPSAEGGDGYGMECLKKDVERAIGADILFEKEDKRL
ncbi:MAG: V-type ATP synthase subunit F [Christensenellales bacterium]|mgnify:CR=1 FL=1|jgi:V/A-type H+-transporting ATPase subunit F|nr:V-type ATP synthase subunit F [Clostridia bacterium]HRU84855.1 V-type ATP synthase subunit F [Eubacteriales bacterium]